MALPPSSSSSPKGCSGGRDLLLFCDGLLDGFLCRSLLDDLLCNGLLHHLLGGGLLRDGFLCRSLLRYYFLSRSLLGNGFLCGCFFLNGHFNPPPLFRMGGLCEKFVNKSLLNVNKLLDDVRQRIF